jgi:MFS transporter, MHS family, proline/betaine transporter
MTDSTKQWSSSRKEAQTGEARPQSRAKVIFAALLGTTVEYYDFAIFGYMATYMSALFFVSDDPTASLLGTFAVFAVAFFVRIPGGLFFGHIGDKYDRRTALTWTILLMVFATVAMGLLPSYATLGAWAAALLVLTRLLQGFAVGGEQAGANAFVAESAPTRWRGTQTSFVNWGGTFGTLLAASLALVLASVFTTDEILDWAWRLPYLFSAVLGVIGLWIRFRLRDTPEFTEMKEKNAIVRLPMRELFRNSKRVVLKMSLLCGMITGGYYVATAYSVSYLQTEGGLTPQQSFLSTVIASACAVATLSVAGFVSDLLGRKPVIFTGAICGAVLAIPMFMMMGSGVVGLGILGQSVLLVCVSIVNGVAAVTMIEMVRGPVRYSATALGNNLANMLLGGTAPYLATLSIAITDNPLAPAGMFMVFGLMTAIAALTINETRGLPLERS